MLLYAVHCFAQRGSNKVDKKCGNKAVDKIRKQTANQGDQQVRLNRGFVFFAQCLHICHGVGGCTHTKAAHAGRDHRGVIVTAHYAEHNKVGKYKHQQRLASQQDQQRQGQLGQLPQL